MHHVLGQAVTLPPPWLLQGVGGPLNASEALTGGEERRQRKPLFKTLGATHCPWGGGSPHPHFSLPCSVAYLEFYHEGHFD